MIWSISGFNAYYRCPRKWFYDEKLGSRSEKNAFRHEVYLLSQLESIDAWRGKIVDYTISEFVIPKIRQKKQLVFEEIIAFAKKLTRSRYEFAKSKRYLEKDLKKTAHEYDYAALFEFEFAKDQDAVHQRIKDAWSEIELALQNFLNNTELQELLFSADYLATQRSLTFKMHGFTVRGIPDLIIFFKHKPPQIVDWKVHYWGTKTYNDQLLIYATALTNCEPHKDFKEYFTDYSITDIILSEYQLLKNTVRKYQINEDEIERVNDLIADGLMIMENQGCANKYEALDIEDFQKTPNLNNCKTCAYKKLCQED